MLPGDYDQIADVRDLTTYAIVGGVRRDIESVSLDREISNDLPSQVVGGAGLAGGSGTIVWASQQDAVATREASPWHVVAGWPPQPGARIRVYVTDGATSWPRFTGRIDKTSGSVAGGLRSDIVDYRDQLNVPFTYPAVLAQDVPNSSGGNVLFPDLNAWHLLTFAFRRARFYNTIPAGDGVSLSAPMQGSVRAHRGSTLTAQGATGGTWPVFHWAPWGQAVGVVAATYRPHQSSLATISQPLRVSLMVGPDHAGTTHVRVLYGSNPDDRIRVRVWADRRLTAFWNNTPVVELSADQMRDATVVTLYVRGSTWELRNDVHAADTATFSRSGTQVMAEIQVNNSEAARMAGLVVDSPSSWEYPELGFTPSATYEPSSLVRRMQMSPRLENENLADFVDEVCNAALIASWFDETGVLRLVHSNNLRNRTPAQELTTLDDITALDWELSLLNVRHRVNVTFKDAVISRSRNFRQELYRAGRNTMDAGDTIEIFATPSNDEEWFWVDRDPQRVDDSNWGWYNSAARSFIGVHYRNADGDELSTAGRTTTITAEELGTVSLKITHRAGSYESGVEAHLAVSENSPAVRESRQGDALPVIRGRGHGQWVDDMYTSPIMAASLPDGTTAAELTHDLSYYGGPDAAQRLGDFLAERVTRIEPVINQLRVTYDPRRQLGDVVTISAGVLDVTVTALIVGIHETHEHGAHEQRLQVRIIDAHSTRQVTYDELAEAWAGRDYTGLQTVWANLTYNDFTNDPLRGAPNP